MRAAAAIVFALAACGGGGGGLPDAAQGLLADAPGTIDGAAIDGAEIDGAPADASGDGQTADAAPDAMTPTPDAATTLTCATALLYNDCDPSLDANCFSIAEALFSDDAAQRLGIATLYGGVGNQPAFQSLYDAGGFDVIVFESSTNVIDPATATRLAAWVGGGGKIVFSYWDLDGSTVGPGLRTALQVSTPASFNTPRSVYPDPASTVNFFDRVETFPAPLGFSNIGLDDGDELATTAGFLAARLTSVTGPGAIAVTRAGRAVVLGFLPIELVYQIVRDADADGIPDVEELYTNALGYLCGS